jgi:hypothetical protein
VTDEEILAGPMTAANVVEWNAALKRKIHSTDDTFAKQLADVNARIAAARADGAIETALGLLPVLRMAAGLQSSTVDLIEAGLRSAAKLIGLAPDVVDAIKGLADP